MPLQTLLATGLFISLAAFPSFAADKPPVQKHWMVSGQVQGVGFRAYTYESATDLKLVGWVRNLTDSRVEIVVRGPEKDVAELLKKVKKGPPGGHVDEVKEAAVDANEKLADHFEIHDSAVAPK